MRSLVIMALLGCAYAAPFLQYTPEVVAERARFQQLYNAAAAAAAAAPDPVPSGASHFHQAPAVSHHHHAQAPATFTTGWTGPVAATIPAGVPGSAPQVSDTADVSAARDAFLAAYRAQVTATTGQQFAAPAVQTFSSNSIVQQTPRWTGPVAATIPAGVSGPLTPVGDTADVSAAKAAFQAAYNRAVAATTKTAPAPAPQFHQAPQPAHHTFHAMPSHISHAPQPKWMGPVAATVPAGLPGSVAQVGPTADVAAATQAFHQAYSAAVAATTGRRF